MAGSDLDEGFRRNAHRGSITRDAWSVGHDMAGGHGQWPTGFVSAMFQRFLKSNIFKHVLNASYHPATNGLAEWFVQTVKQALKASWKDDKHATINQRMVQFIVQGGTFYSSMPP